MLGKGQGSLRGRFPRYVIVYYPHHCILTNSFSIFAFQNLQKDEEVFARYNRGPQFYEATIVKVLRGGKFRVRYHRDDKEEDLESQWIRRPRDNRKGMVASLCHIPSFPLKVP